MPSNLKYIIARISGVPFAVNWLNRKRPLVLAYHGIYDGPRRIGDLPPTFVNSRDMTDQLIYIKKRYRILTPEEFLINLEKDNGFPPNSALITFDDGYESFDRLAEPVLKELGIRAVVFIPTDYVEQNKPFWFELAWFFLKYTPPKKTTWLFNTLGIEEEHNSDGKNPVLCIEKMKTMYPEHRDSVISEIMKILSCEVSELRKMQSLFYPMTYDQLRKLSSMGTVFGGHTQSHTILSVLSILKAESEILENKKRLESLFDKPCECFAYPNGGKGDFGKEHKELLRKAGYRAAFSLTQRRSLPYDDPMDISRFNVAPEDTQQSLTLHCSGIGLAVKRLRRASDIKAYSEEERC